MSPETLPAADTPHARGTLLVLAMFAFGGTATAGLFAFWSARTAPFASLSGRIAAEFPDSSPRVEGGRRRDEPDATVLQVMMRVPFDPADDTAVEGLLSELATLVASSAFAGRYDRLEAHLRRDGPDGRIVSRTETVSLETVSDE